MDINSILCIGRDELMETKHKSHESSRRVSSGQRYMRDVRPNSVVDIYSPSSMDMHGTRYRVEKERNDVVTFKRPDNRHRTTNNRPPSYDLLRHRSHGTVRQDPRRQLVQSARERFLSNVTDVNFLLCRGYTNYDNSVKFGSDKTHFDIKKGNTHAYGKGAHSARPVRILSSHRDRTTQQEVPRVKYVTEIVQPCSVIVSPRKQETARADNDAHDSVEYSPCLLRSKSAPPGNGSKAGKRVSFGPESIFGESTA